MVAAAQQRPCLSLWERCPSAHTGAERVSLGKENVLRTPSQSKIGCEEPVCASRLRVTRSAALTAHRAVIHYRRLRFAYPQGESQGRLRRQTVR